MVLLATVLGGCWSLEQPGGSLLEYYPTWRMVIRKVFEWGGPYAVLHLVLIVFPDHDGVLGWNAHPKISS